ncbi:MAG TPA: NAD(P)/FAD-dependent oxidoreductase [Tepidisphaeraceae bacterium]
MRKRLHIGVVGGGIAGCASALMLARDGHEVDLFERTPRIGPVGAGILLQPSGQAVLQNLGLLESIAAVAEPIDELIAYTHRNRLLSRLPYRDHTPGMYALGVHRADLFAVIHGALVGSGVRVHLGQIINGTIATAEKRVLLADDKSIGAFDMVIAADGSRSALRQVSGLQAFVHAYQPAALWAVGHSNQVRGQLMQYTRGACELCGLLPMGGGRCSFFWGVDQREWATLRTHSFADWRSRVLRLAPLSESIFETVKDWSALLFSSYRAVVMPRVVRDRLVIIGDAAHAAGPHLGQGVNLALMDAALLCASLEANESLHSALNGYNAAQRNRNAWYSFATAALMPSFQGRLPGLGWARDQVLPRLQQLPPIRRLMLQTLCGRW